MRVLRLRTRRPQKSAEKKHEPRCRSRRSAARFTTSAPTAATPRSAPAWPMLPTPAAGRGSPAPGIIPSAPCRPAVSPSWPAATRSSSAPVRTRWATALRAPRPATRRDPSAAHAAHPQRPDPAHPTRILGAGWDSGCAAPARAVGHGRPWFMLNLTDSSNVEIACLEITDHSGCVEGHSGGLACERDNPPTAIGLRSACTPRTRPTFTCGT